MGSRGLKTVEALEETSPSDERACDLHEDRLSSSDSSWANGPDNDTYSSSSDSVHDDDFEEDDEVFSIIMASLSGGDQDLSEKLVALTELCDVLSFDEYSISTETCDALSPRLVELASDEAIPDIALLAIRAMTYLCDSLPQSSRFLVRDNAVTVLCMKLTAIDDMDVAEQSLQALEKISLVEPLACSLAGAIMAVLSFLDFFSTTVQRVALSTVMNICKKLPSEPASLFMDAVPTLCNLLENEEDQRLVEIVTVCLIRIAGRVRRSPERLGELCRHGLIPRSIRLLSNSALPHHVRYGLLGVCAKLSWGSIEAYETLHQLGVSRVLKDIFTTSSDLSRGVLKVLDELLPTASDDDRLTLTKINFLQSRTQLVQNLGNDLLTSLVNLVGSDSYICYGSLCIINKLIHLCTSDALLDVLKNANISSFLAGIFTKKDPHVLLLALQTAESILQKLSTEFLHSFVKEGVFFAIDELLVKGECPLATISESSGSVRCLCYAFAPLSQGSSCKIKKASVYDLAKCLRTSYFPSESGGSDETTTAVLRELRGLSAELSEALSQHDDKFESVLHQIVERLNGDEPISTFEFNESRIVQSLAKYMSDDGNGLSLEKRSRVFARHFLSSSKPMSTLVRKLQDGLSSLETFPVTLSNEYTPTDDILDVLKKLDDINRSSFSLISQDKVDAFSRGELDDLDSLKTNAVSVQRSEFVNAKLTEKLELQMRDPLAATVGEMPTWCGRLVHSYPFLFGFETRRKFFRMAAFGERRRSGEVPRRKFLVSRRKVLESAARVVEKLNAGDESSSTLEVEYKGEVGSGLGPTLEFYTLVSREFQRSGMGMWRDDHTSSSSEFVMSPSGLFPRPWPSSAGQIQFDKFALLGQIVARALQDRRVLDIPLSKAFYKLIIGKKLELSDVLSFDPGLGQTMIEFTALVGRKHSSLESEPCYRGDVRIEDLCLDFTLPGYPDFVLAPGLDEETVTIRNLEDYVSLVLDATLNSGISKQMEAFRSGFGRVFPIETLAAFDEEELEKLLCGECKSWTIDELTDHIRFDHGYTATSRPIVDLMEILMELDEEERRAFLQFVTGTPRLPLGGFSSLSPKLTVVRKHSTSELPSAMTCANYLKLPPYSSKAVLKQKLLYAITEGQGSFHFS